MAFAQEFIVSNKKHFASILALFLASSNVAASEEEGLIALMGSFQYFMHKTALSLDARNLELLKFYTHEVEENLEEAEKFGDFDGFDIGAMVKKILAPEFEKFEKHVDAKELDMADKQYDKILEACNSCHSSVDRGYIHIRRSSQNPYMQSFAP
jgi:hypothetical protein